MVRVNAAVLGLLISVPAAGQELTAPQPPAVGILVVNPRAAEARLRMSTVFAEIEAHLRQEGQLGSVVFEEDVSSCGGELHCWVERAQGAIGAPFTLIVSVRSLAGAADSLLLMLFDSREALERIREGRRSPEIDRGVAIDASLLEHALLARVTLDEVHSADDLRTGLLSATSSIAGPLIALGAWRSHGRIELDLRVAGAAIEMDGVTLGVSDGERVKISGVSAGARSLRIQHPDYEPFSLEANVLPGAIFQRDVRLTRISFPLSERVRVETWWATGLSLAAAGALVVYGAVQTSSLDARCLRFAESDQCSAPGYARLFPPSGIGAATADGSPASTGTGPLIIPLGIALATGGVGTWVVDAVLTPEDDSDTWLPWVVGAAAGIGVYVIGEAAHGAVRGEPLPPR
jgi:hypothetical protein